MPSISLDGFSPLKRYENFYLWLALGLAIQGTRGAEGMGAGGRGQGVGETRGQGDKGTRGENLKQVFPLVPNSPCPQVLFPMPNAQCPIPNYRWSMGV
ncbi:hypothetical protein [Nostoc sp. FACHB-133]|uniref:hypothetical protein n=1 Tax=Nostoc sp. FACHB-133 TaxID=2692835 RepID=UPI001684BF96|nr:hypothetical protein [Nostoc sp. FACHB-133]MBD2522031.1 hypothetical protein [Nostoc sp. FACHB-133]